MSKRTFRQPAWPWSSSGRQAHWHAPSASWAHWVALWPILSTRCRAFPSGSQSSNGVRAMRKTKRTAFGIFKIGNTVPQLYKRRWWRNEGKQCFNCSYWLLAFCSFTLCSLCLGLYLLDSAYTWALTGTLLWRGVSPWRASNKRKPLEAPVRAHPPVAHLPSACMLLEPISPLKFPRCPTRSDLSFQNAL